MDHEAVICSDRAKLKLSNCELNALKSIKIKLLSVFLLLWLV